MKFNIKVILLGGLAMYVAEFLLSMATGGVIHEGILTELYQANASFWRPELNQQPPDMAALMPRVDCYRPDYHVHHGRYFRQHPLSARRLRPG